MRWDLEIRRAPGYEFLIFIYSKLGFLGKKVRLKNQLFFKPKSCGEKFYNNPKHGFVCMSSVRGCVVKSSKMGRGGEE